MKLCNKIKQLPNISINKKEIWEWEEIIDKVETKDHIKITINKELTLIQDNKTWIKWDKHQCLKCNNKCKVKCHQVCLNKEFHSHLCLCQLVQLICRWCRELLFRVKLPSNINKLLYHYFLQSLREIHTWKKESEKQFSHSSRTWRVAKELQRLLVCWLNFL